MKDGAHVVKLHRDAEQYQESLWGQADLHRRQRRLNEAPARLRGRSLKEDGGDGGTIGAVGVSSYHSFFYTAEIQLGTPPQPFNVNIDTGSSDLWVLGAACDETCLPGSAGLSKYDPSKSTSYRPASEDPELNSFHSKYADGLSIDGAHANDVLRLGDSIAIGSQTFAQATSLSNYKSTGFVGILGLGFSDISSHNFNTTTHNLVPLLKHPMFSLYLDRTDDYPATNPMIPASSDQPRPVSASSELVFGGVNQKHYEGCLTWHDLGQFADLAGTTFQGYWDFKLDSVYAGSSKIPSSQLAIADTGATTLVGPSQAVEEWTKANYPGSVVCLKAKNKSNPEDVSIVDCGGPLGFDVAAMASCDLPLASLSFEADGTRYTLEKEDLIMRVETAQGPICIILILANPLLPGWILGDPFLNAHYSAYDFVNKRIAFAHAAKDSSTICEADLAMDISHGEDSKSTTPPTPTALPTHASSPPPTPLPTKAPLMVGAANIETTNLSVPQPTKEQKASSFATSATISFLAIMMILLVAIIVRRRSQRRVRFQEVASGAEELEMRDME